MASVEAIVVTVFLHLILRFPLHISFEVQSVGPRAASVIVDIAILLLIYNNRVLPIRFSDHSIQVKCFIESFLATCILELCKVVWTSFEILIAVIVSAILLGFDIISRKTMSENETLIIGSFTMPLSLMILFTVYQTNTRIYE